MVSLRKNKRLFAGLIICIFTLVGCGGVTFDTPPDGDVTDLSVGTSFPYSSKVETFKQDDLLENQVTLSFQAFKSDGDSLTSLNKNDFQLSENGQNINNFSFNSKSSVVSKADIVFVIDKTGSMKDEINGVKENVRNFVNELRSVNILANLCLVTFNDRVQDECLSFQADDPSTPNNENLDDFLDRLERVSVTGGGDINENQLAGLISAAERTPWRSDAQRITILMTDEGFSHTGNPGDAGSDARGYKETYDILKAQRVINYIVGPSIPGYSSPFSSTPALALEDNYFDIKELIENASFSFASEVGADSKKDLGDILTEIATSLSTVYTITYNVNQNNLNPNLKVSQRNVELDVVTHAGSRVVLKPLTATYPEGHPVRRSQWALRHEINSGNRAKVYVDEVKMSEINYSIDDQIITFNSPPEAGAFIKVIYASAKISGGLNLKQIKLDVPRNDNTELVVYYNGIRADGLDYVISKSSNGRYHLVSVVPEALDNNDKYLVEANKGLLVTFKIENIVLDVK